MAVEMPPNQSLAAIRSPLGEFLHSTPAASNDTRVSRIYQNANGELKLSSNWFSHVFRKLTGKPQGLEALKNALGDQFNLNNEMLLRIGQRIPTNASLLLNPIVEESGDDLAVGELRPHLERILAEKFDEPQVEEFDAKEGLLEQKQWNFANMMALKAKESE